MLDFTGIKKLKSDKTLSLFNVIVTQCIWLTFNQMNEHRKTTSESTEEAYQQATEANVMRIGNY